jgi:integrase
MAGKELSLADVVGGALIGGPRSADADARFAAMLTADRVALTNDGTADAYRGSLKPYAAWCRQHGVPAAPATPAQLGAYVKHLTTTPAVTPDGRPVQRSPRSIDRAIAAVQALHRDKGFPRVDTVHARAYLNAYAHHLGTQNHPAAKSVKAQGATRTKLRQMLATVDRRTLRGKRDAAVLLIGYSVLGRASETAALDFGNVRLADGGMYVSVYRKKTKVWTETPVPRQTDPAVCPVVAFEQLRDELAARGVTSGRLFRAVDSHDFLTQSLGRPPKDAKVRTAKAKNPPEGISTATVSNIVKRAATAAGLADGDVRWSGHSLRRGGAQDMAANPNAKREHIETAGGWSKGSVAVGEYLDGSLTMTDSLIRLDEEQRAHCDTCTCHAPAAVDVDDVWDAEVLD